VQLNNKEKVLYVHIPRTGGSWFSYNWPYADRSDIYIKNNGLGRHGKLSGILRKLDDLRFDYNDFRIVTTVREPMDRIASSWVWFSKVKGTALKHGWKTIDDMMDEYESGATRVNYLPQTHWLCEENAKFDIIYRFEDLLENSYLPQRDFKTFGTGETSSKQLIRQGQNRISLLTPAQKQRIKKLYKDDFDFLSQYYKDLT